MTVNDLHMLLVLSNSVMNIQDLHKHKSIAPASKCTQTFIIWPTGILPC